MPIVLELKVSYTIGKDTPPVIYVTSYGDYTIKMEMSGEISIENLTPGHQTESIGYELAMSKNSLEAKQKLYSTYDPALAALMAKPEMAFKSGRVTIKAPIAAKTNIGPYAIEVQAVSPMQMTGSLKPPKAEGTLELGRRRFKFSTELEYKVDVIWTKRPQSGPEMVKVESVELKDNRPIETLNWDQLVEEKGVVEAVVTILTGAATLFIYRFMTKGVPLPAVSMSPFVHTIDMNNNST